MIRELISRFNRSLSEHLVSSRRPTTAPIKIWFDPEANTERAVEAARSACILGETVDMSSTGIGFLVPVIRLKEKYLVGHDRNLNVEIDLPTGKVYMRVIGRRYEKVEGIHMSMERFFVGAHITSLQGPDKQNYEAYLTGNHGRVKATPASLETGY